MVYVPVNQVVTNSISVLLSTLAGAEQHYNQVRKVIYGVRVQANVKQVLFRVRNAVPLANAVRSRLIM